MSLNQGETWYVVNFTLEEDRQILLFNFHHIISDRGQ